MDTARPITSFGDNIIELNRELDNDTRDIYQINRECSYRDFIDEYLSDTEYGKLGLMNLFLWNQKPDGTIHDLLISHEQLGEWRTQWLALNKVEEIDETAADDAREVLMDNIMDEIGEKAFTAAFNVRWHSRAIPQEKKKSKKKGKKK